MFAYRIGDPREDLAPDDRDNAACCALGAVIDSAFTWGATGRRASPGTRRSSASCTSAALRSCTPRLPVQMRGTYAGLGSEEVLRHLQDLGVTAVELMPVHHHAYDRHLVEQGCPTTGGYNTSAFFAPNLRYAMNQTPSDSVREFKTRVRNLRSGSIEVILDVVYNHTAEGHHTGPDALPARGGQRLLLPYRLAADNPRFYVDYTAAATAEHAPPRVLQSIMDSLRY